MKHLIITIALAFVALPAFATGSRYIDSGSGSSACQPALPVYDESIRKRPLAFVNESARGVPAFGNCMFRYQANSYGTEWVAVKLSNRNAQAVTVACTGVLGVEKNARFVVRNYPVPANGETTVKFTTADFNRGAEYKAPGAIQCLLPVNVGVTETENAYRHSN